MASRANNAARVQDTPGYLAAIRRELPSLPENRRRPRANRPGSRWTPDRAVLYPILLPACEHFGVTYRDLIGPYRHKAPCRAITLARRLAACMLRARYRWSLHEIGRALHMHHDAVHVALWQQRWEPVEHGLVFEAYRAGRDG
jgi:hypothetical protein